MSKHLVKDMIEKGQMVNPSIPLLDTLSSEKKKSHLKVRLQNKNELLICGRLPNLKVSTHNRNIDNF